MATQSPFAKFVHEYKRPLGQIHYAVCEWVERAAQYQWPLRHEERQASGCSGGFSRSASASTWRYHTYQAALNAARRIYGERVAFERLEAEI